MPDVSTLVKRFAKMSPKAINEEANKDERDLEKQAVDPKKSREYAFTLVGQNGVPQPSRSSNNTKPLLYKTPSGKVIDLMTLEVPPTPREFDMGSLVGDVQKLSNKGPAKLEVAEGKILTITDLKKFLTDAKNETDGKIRGKREGDKIILFVRQQKGSKLSRAWNYLTGRTQKERALAFKAVNTIVNFYVSGSQTMKENMKVIEAQKKIDKEMCQVHHDALANSLDTFVGNIIAEYPKNIVLDDTVAALRENWESLTNSQGIMRNTDDRSKLVVEKCNMKDAIEEILSKIYSTLMEKMNLDNTGKAYVADKDYVTIFEEIVKDFQKTELSPTFEKVVKDLASAIDQVEAEKILEGGKEFVDQKAINDIKKSANNAKEKIIAGLLLRVYTPPLVTQPNKLASCKKNYEANKTEYDAAHRIVVNLANGLISQINGAGRDKADSSAFYRENPSFKALLYGDKKNTIVQEKLKEWNQKLLTFETIDGTVA